MNADGARVYVFVGACVLKHYKKKDVSLRVRCFLCAGSRRSCAHGILNLNYVFPSNLPPLPLPLRRTYVHERVAKKFSLPQVISDGAIIIVNTRMETLKEIDFLLFYFKR